MSYSRNDMVELALLDCDELIKIIDDEVISPGRLTFALEEVGRYAGPDGLRVLLNSLEHKSPIVREGALYGLLYWITNVNIDEAHLERLEKSSIVFARIREVVQNDPSPGVRGAAEEVIEDLEDWMKENDSH